MRLKVWRFATITLTALSMSVAMGHLLEMPAKMNYDGALWLHLLQTLYYWFGAVGGYVEAGAVLSAVALAFLVRRRGAAFAWTVGAALCLVATHLIFWIGVAPVNAALLPLTPETLPADWTALRTQWEYSHATRALLQILALAALLVSVLVETPAQYGRG